MLGFWTPVFAFVAFFMVLNFSVASGLIFKYSFLTNGYGLPVLGVHAGARDRRGASAVERYASRNYTLIGQFTKDLDDLAVAL